SRPVPGGAGDGATGQESGNARVCLFVAVLLKPAILQRLEEKRAEHRIADKNLKKHEASFMKNHTSLASQLPIPSYHDISSFAHPYTCYHSMLLCYNSKVIELNEHGLNPLRLNNCKHLEVLTVQNQYELSDIKCHRFATLQQLRTQAEHQKIVKNLNKDNRNERKRLTAYG
ncbi:hypothetical protein STEG23_015463, partial [Scotinomys teguina]